MWRTRHSRSNEVSTLVCVALIVTALVSFESTLKQLRIKYEAASIYVLCAVMISLPMRYGECIFSLKGAHCKFDPTFQELAHSTNTTINSDFYALSTFQARQQLHNRENDNVCSTFTEAVIFPRSFCYIHSILISIYALMCLT